MNFEKNNNSNSEDFQKIFWVIRMKYMHLYFMIYFTIFSILPQKILKNKEESYFFVIYNNMFSNTLIDTVLILLYN